MQQDYLDFRSIDRISGESNDFVIQLPQFLRSQKVSSVSFSNLELPSVRHTVENKENSMAISEGIYIGEIIEVIQNKKSNIAKDYRQRMHGIDRARIAHANQRFQKDSNNLQR